MRVEIDRAVHQVSALAEAGQSRRIDLVPSLAQQPRHPLVAPAAMPGAVNQNEGGHGGPPAIGRSAQPTILAPSCHPRREAAASPHIEASLIDNHSEARFGSRCEELALNICRPLITFPRDGRVRLPLRLIGRGWQACKVRRAVRALPNQDGSAAEDYGSTLCPGLEQHRQDTEKPIVADDDIDVDVAQNLLQRIVLQRNGVDEGAPQDDATANKPRRTIRQAVQLGNERSDVLKVGIRARGKQVEPCSDVFEALAEALPDNPMTSWPSLIRMRPIAAIGLTCPAAGVEAMTILISCSLFTRRDEAAIATRSVEQSSRVAQAGEAPEMLLRLEAGSASDACRQNLVSWTSRPAR